MTETLYKYHGAGNDFIVINNLDGHISLTKTDIRRLCNRHYGIGSDGLMLLERPEAAGHDFKMMFFNPDGSSGMMCGNGGRCITAFAAFSGIRKEDGHYVFEAPDGIHEAFILTDSEDDSCVTVRLKMNDVNECRRVSLSECGGCSEDGLSSEGLFLDTGTRHFVLFAEDTGSLDVVSIGRPIRYSAPFAPIGANVDFVEDIIDSVHPHINVRTYEKGVEDETEACGTGVTASAIAACVSGVKPTDEDKDGRFSYSVQARSAMLQVDFIPAFAFGKDEFKDDALSPVAKDVWLTGPATRVAKITMEI